MNSTRDVVKVIFVTSSSRRGVKLSTNTTYNKLVNYVENKFNISMDDGYSLSYILSPNDLPLEIKDDDDVTFLIDVAGNANEKPIELYVLDPIVTPQKSMKQFTSSHLPASHYPTEPTHFSIPQPSSKNPHQSYENTHQYDYNFYQSHTFHYDGTSQNNFWDVGPSNPEYADSRKHNVETTEDSAEKDSGKGIPAESDTDYGFISGEDDESDQVNEQYIPPKDWKNNTFSNMPDPLPTPTINTQHTIPKIYDGRTTVQLAKGMWFSNKKHCKYVIAQKSIEDGYQYKVRSSSKTRYDVVCYNTGCDWKIVTNRSKNGDPFYVSLVNDIHTCSTTKLNSQHRNAYKEVLGDIIMDKLKDPNRTLRPKDIMEDINNTYHIKISYQQAWRGREAALEKLRGGHAESYSKLPFYLHNLKLKNPGTVTDVKTDQYGRFEMCFVMLGISINSFLNHLRPIIIVDGAHLKGKYPGSNLLAVGMDGNNQIVPMAYGICDGESGATWTWFMMKLRQCIGEVSNLVFISDRHHAIAQGIREVFPSAFHGLCCRHLLMNINLPKKFDWLFWKICKAHQIFEYDHWMNLLFQVNENAFDKLVDVGQQRWSRAHCPVNRYNYVTSNCVESVNALSTEARKMPITMLMEFFRGLVQRWYFERHEDAVKYEQLGQRITTYAEKKIHKRIKKSNGFRVYGISRSRFQVNDRKQDCLVDLDTSDCTCKKWQHSGLPCGHVIAVLRQVGIEDCSHLAKHWFTIQTYKATYAQESIFVGDVSTWVIPDNMQRVLPPNSNKRNAGRPKKTGRIPSKGEKVKIKVCTRCGAEDHKNSQCRVSMTSTQTFVYPTVDLNDF